MTCDAQAELDERLAGPIALERVAMGVHVRAVEHFDRVPITSPPRGSSGQRCASKAPSRDGFGGRMRNRPHPRRAPRARLAGVAEADRPHAANRLRGNDPRRFPRLERRELTSDMEDALDESDVAPCEPESLGDAWAGIGDRLPSALSRLPRLPLVSGLESTA